MLEDQIKVIHKMRNKNLPNTFYVGRPSILGNPYTHLVCQTKADVKVDSVNEAIECYEEYINEEIDNGNEQIIEALQPMLLALEEGKTIHLACWCKDEVTPFVTDNKYCHADVIRNILLDEMEAEE